MSVIGKAMGEARKAALVLAAGASLLVATASSPAAATALDLTLQGSPDMMCDFIEVRYDAATGTLTATGFAEDFATGVLERNPILNGTFEITANLASSGELKSGVLTVNGEVPSLGIPQGVLLTGKLNDLGGEKDGPLELKFDTSGGALGFNFGPLVNVIVSQSGFPGDFAQSFTSNPIAVAGIGW